MKLAEFFRQSIETIDYSLALLEQPTKPSEKNPIRMLCVEPEEKLQRLTALFSAEPQPRHLTHYAVHSAHYLNLLIMDVSTTPTGSTPGEPTPQETQEPQTQKPASTPNKADFFFLPIDPITIVYNSECSPQLMSKYLGFIKKELEQRRDNLLTGWQVNRSPKGLCFYNSASSIDWHLFLSCINGQNPPADENKIMFEGQGVDNAELVCRITAEKYLQLHHEHGVSLLDSDTLFLSALRKVLLENQQEYLQKHRSFLLTQLQSKSASELAGLTESIARNGKATAMNGCLAFYDTLDTISFIFLQSKKLLTHPPVPISLNSASRVTEKRKSIVVSLDDLSTHFDEDSRQPFIDCITQLLRLLKTAQTLPMLKEPYRYQNEALISDVLLNLNTVLTIISTLKQIMAKAEPRSNQMKVCVQWLQESAMVIFYDIIETFFECRYHSAIIQLSCAVITLLQVVKSKVDENSITFINQSIYQFKDNLLNSLLTTGQYSFLLNCLNYFSQLLPQLCDKQHYDFYLQKASDHNYLALVSQHRSDYATARSHLDKAWEYLECVVNPQFLPSGLDSTPYFESTKSTIESLALCYRALGTEEFEDRNFQVAKTLCEKGKDEKVLEITVRLKNVVLLPQRKVVTTKLTTKKELTIDDSRINAHWCSLYNFISIRDWLSKNLKNPNNFSAANGQLILTSSKKNGLNILSAHLSEKKIPHGIQPKEIILEDFSTIELRAIQEAFSAYYGQVKPAPVKDEDSAQQNRPALHPSEVLENPDSEELELFNLKSMHYKSIHHYEGAYFELVAESLEAFYQRCKDPRSKIRALSFLVSSLLARSLFLRTTQEGSDNPDSLLKKAKEFAAAGRQFAVEQFSSEKQTADSKVIETLDTLDARIVDHETILSEYLPMRDLVKAQTILSTLHNTVKGQPAYCYSMLLGASNILANYNQIATLRNNLLQKTLCLRKDTYQKRVEFIRQLTLFSFELAYELFSQPALGNPDNNTEEQAFARIQEEYRILLELQRSMNIVFSESVQSAILVVRSAIEKESPLESRLQLLDQAFKLVKTNPNTLKSALILLRKIDYVISCEINDSFRIIHDLLKSLMIFIRGTQSQRSLKNELNSVYVAHEVCAFISNYLTLSQGNLMRFEAHSLRDSFTVQLAILEQYRSIILAQHTPSPMYELVKSYCEPAIACVKKSLSILQAIPIEEKVREDLRKKNKKTGEIHFLIPKLLLSEMRLSEIPANQHDLFAPCSPLISLVLSCHEMLDYELNREKLGSLFNDELNTAYKLITNNVVQTLDTFLPERLAQLLKGENQNSSCLTPLYQVFQAMNNAHSPNGKSITADTIPMIRQLLSLYPDQPYLNFTLYRALADNTSKDTECPELVQACYKAAEAGHTFAQYRYACLLQTGNYGTDKHEGAARIYLDQAAQSGYYKAEIRLAKLHKQGLFGYEQNKKFAKMHAKRALGNPELPENLASNLRTDYNILFIPIQFE